VVYPLECHLSIKGFINFILHVEGGDSHQLESYPNLPVSKKIEVLVERFNAPGVSLADKSVNPSSTTLTHSGDTWVTVSPKKRVRSFHTPRQPKTSNLNAMGSNVILTPVQEQE